MSDRFWLRALGTEAGRHTIAQMDLAAALRRRLETLPDSKSVRQMVGFIYERSEIRQRHLELSLDTLDQRTDWYQAVNEATVSLAERALHTVADHIPQTDVLITVSSSFQGFPSLSRQLQQRHGFSPDTACFDLTGLGCAGPTQGIHLAQRLLSGDGHRTAMVLAADVMGTHGASRRHSQAPDLSQVVAHCLASDGAAVAVLGREPGPSPCFSYAATELRTRLWDDALGENDYTADQANQPYMSVGKQIRTRLLSETEPFFAPEVLAQPLFLHPGGAALMRMLEVALPQLSQTISVSNGVLRDNGNVGSASVLWVLERALREGMPVAPELGLFALGPGIVTTLLQFHDVEAP